MEWKEVKLFISSTFNDMHAERDYLVQEVFPELREWCEARRIRLTDIDLRWGVTREDAESGNTLKTCLNCIDECRPFFLCFLGQRRGWVPDPEKDTDEDVLSYYLGLREKLGKYSITELEIEHAVLAPMVHLLSDHASSGDRSRALFFLRKDPFEKGVLTEAQRKIYTNAADNEAENDRKLAECKDKIVRECVSFHYDCVWDTAKETKELRALGDVSKGSLTDFSYEGRPLREIILEEMKKRILREFPEQAPAAYSDPYDEDAMEQELFVQTAAFGFVGRDAELSYIHLFMESRPEGGSLIIAAPEGTGKTALLAKTCQILRQKGHRVLYRSQGVSDRSVTEREFYLSIGNEAGLFRGTEEEKDRDVQLGSKARISSAFLEKLKANGYDVLILDGLNVKGSVKDISKLSGTILKTVIPQGFFLIESLDIPKGFSPVNENTIELRPLETSGEREQLIDTYLHHVLKKMDKEEKQLIISSPGASSPLYLKVLLNELKTFGSFADLKEKIRSFGNTPKDAFNEMLRTVEEEFAETAGMTAAAVSMLTYARDGLTENELLSGLKSVGISCPELPRQLRMLLRRLRTYLTRLNGKSAVLIESFKDAVIFRYGSSERKWRMALAAVYEDNLRSSPASRPNEWNSVHGDKELLYQLELADSWPDVQRVMNDLNIFRNIWPPSYGVHYVNGTSYAADTATLGYTQDISAPEGAEHMSMVADILLHKAILNRKEIMSKYKKPLSDTCASLRTAEDKTGFYEYRDLFYYMITFADISVGTMIRVADAGGNRPDKTKQLCSDYLKSAKDLESAIWALSLDGAEITDLSHAIEDMADDVNRKFDRLREYGGSICR